MKIIALALIATGLFAGPHDNFGVECTTTLNWRDDVVAEVSASNPGDTVCLEEGLYRTTEPIVPKNGMTLIGPHAVIDGSAKIQNWTKAGDLWYADGYLPAPYSDVGQCEDNVANLCQRREQLFDTNQRVQRVGSVAEVVPGTFYADYSANRIYVGEKSNRMELGRTQYAINSTASDVTIQGLVFQKFASPAQKGAVFVNGGDRWTIVNSSARLNHAIGFYLTQSDDSIIWSTKSYANGQLGIGVHRSQNVTIKHGSVFDNNQEGFWVTDWESGGIKFTYSNVYVWNNDVYSNKGIGVWGDGDNTGVWIYRNRIRDNEADGVRYEISYDAVITQNTVTNNNWGTGRGKCNNPYCGGGINSNTSKNVEIAYNTVTDNQNGVVLRASNRGGGELGPWVLEDNYVHNNYIQMPVPLEWGNSATGLVQNAADNSYFTTRGNVFENNDYDLGDPNGRHFAWNNTYMTYQNWIANEQN